MIEQYDRTHCNSSGYREYSCGHRGIREYERGNSQALKDSVEKGPKHNDDMQGVLKTRAKKGKGSYSSSSPCTVY